MTATATESGLPLVDQALPRSSAEVAQAIATAGQSRLAVYPLGGCVGLRYGAIATRPGLGLSLAGMNRVIDYPWQDLTITVEAGITLAALSATLAERHQRLPIDVSAPERATIGGAIACNAAGPRRMGHGTLRDYLLGFEAADGRGELFRGGAKVVKNAAGYDLPKLMVGALGSLAVATQVTLMVRPAADATAALGCWADTLDAAELLLADLNRPAVLPVAIELMQSGSGGRVSIRISFEGSPSEIEWMAGEVRQAVAARGMTADALAWDQGPAFAAASWLAADASELTLVGTVRPSSITQALHAIGRIAGASCEAYPTCGVWFARVPCSAADEARRCLAELRPALAALGGACAVVSLPGRCLSSIEAWGPAPAGGQLMQVLKRQFDPLGILNPGRTAYEGAVGTGQFAS